ncbi:hypothetical protein E8E14_006302 [Neopestalotiopsis sp. 37M]|nr:hypothetical protein E8E14_006302 [Neopestalotiopsis sp. 37M]
MKRFEIIDKKTNEALCNLGYEDNTMTVASFESHIRKECALGPDVQIALFTAVNELNQNGSLKALVAHALMRDHLPYDGKIYMDYPITKDEAEQKKESSQFLIQNNLVEGHGKNNNIISKDLEKEEVR